MPKKRDVFLKYYNKLNSEQKQAVNEIEGPVMVIAGPGTGKTQILTLRIANILRKTDTNPQSILALTFTEAGTVAMRKRLSEIIGETAYYVSIYTFHAFCNDVIKQHSEEFPRIISSRNITEVEQIQIIENIVQLSKLVLLKPFGNPLYYIPSILSNINNLKREGIDADEFSNMVLQKKREFLEKEGLYHTSGSLTGTMKGKYKEEEKKILKNEEFSRVYKRYERELQKLKLYDYSDMIMEVSKTLSKNNDLLLTLQERYQYFLVDEHQDTNNAQNKILELLTGFYEIPNLFIVGDEKQAIFRFQGASLENFLYFQKRYPDTKQIVLKENYRSTQTILNSVHGMAKKMGNSPVLLKSRRPSGAKIFLTSFSQEDVELSWLTSHIQENIEKGIRPHEIAVLYRDNQDAFSLTAHLEKAGIGYSLESDQNIFEDNDIRKLILILNLIEHFGSAEEFFETLHIDFLNINPLDIYTLAEHSTKYRESPFDIIQNKKHLDVLLLHSKDALLSLYNNLLRWKRMDKNEGLISIFEDVVQNSGYMTHILSLRDAQSKIEKTHILFDEIKMIVMKNRKAKLKNLFSYIKTLEDHNLSVKKVTPIFKEGGVRLMTVHKSKGQEFEYVYIIHANDGKWGNKRKPNLLPLVSLTDNGEEEMRNLEDERRLFYVALTRAKQFVSISYVLKNNEGNGLLPSQFLYELDESTVETKSMETFESQYAKRPSFMIPRAKENHQNQKEHIQILFKERGFAVTHLNNFLRCPWEYFYVNLLRIPQAPTKHQMYGIAVHRTLKDFFDDFDARKKPKKKLLIERFKDHLKKEYFSERDFKESERKGERALRGWFDCYNGLWNARKIITEKNVHGIMLGSINLTGKIDRMDILDDENTVIVTDYKTSKPKTRNEIEGKTKNSEGDIKRQLVFYKLLLERYEEGKYTMKTGIIDFIEPDDKGRYKQEVFEISLQEVKALETLIKEVAEKIMSFSFVNERCDRKDCKYCKLREMM